MGCPYADDTVLVGVRDQYSDFCSGWRSLGDLDRCRDRCSALVVVDGDHCTARFDLMIDRRMRLSSVTTLVSRTL